MPSSQADSEHPDNSEVISCLKSIGLNKHYAGIFDENFIGKPLPDDDVPATHRNTYALERAAMYKDSCFVDVDAWMAFRDDFEGWGQEHFSALDKNIKRALRGALRNNGVYTGPLHNHIGPQLSALMVAERLMEWPDDDATRAMEFNPRSWQHRKKYVQTPTSTSAPTPVPLPAPAFPAPAPPAPVPGTSQPVLAPPHPSQSVLAPPHQSQPAPAPPSRDFPPVDTVEEDPAPPLSGGNATPLGQRSHAGTPDHRPRAGTPYPEPFPVGGAPLRVPSMTPFPTIPPSGETNPYRALPPIEHRNVPLEGSKVVTFTKIWDKAMSYTGEPYDILDDKMLHFYETCQQAEIQPGQFHAVFSRMLTNRAREYFLHHMRSGVDRGMSFTCMYTQMKLHFDTNMNHQQYFTDFHNMKFKDVLAEKGNEDKTPLQCLQIMFDKLQLCQRALGDGFQGERMLCSRARDAVQQMPEFSQGLFEDTQSFEKLASNMRAALHLAKVQGVAQYHQSDMFFTDRRYKDSRPKYIGREPNRGPSTTRKRCYVCGKEGCFSTNHSKEEQRASREGYLRKKGLGKQSGREAYQHFLLDYEGIEELSSSDDGESNDDEDDADNHAHFAQAFLSDQAFLHGFTGASKACPKPSAPASQFVLERYDRSTFQGILPDTGAAGQSTGGLEQYQALNRENPGIVLDTSRAGEAGIRFGPGDVQKSIGACKVETPIGKITFHIVDSPTPFLCSLKDLKRCQTILDSNADELIKTLDNGKQIRIPVLMKWGHPWFFLAKGEHAVAFLSEQEIRRLHRRFGHPSAHRLYKLLSRAGHDDVTEKALAEVNKVCHHCQMKSPAPQRFKFTLKDDVDFNHTIYVDVMYLDGKPVLHAIDMATAFNACRFLRSMSTEDTWEALRACWIDVYLGPPDFVVHDQGTNFASSEFRSTARLWSINCVEVPVEAHNAVGKVERAHALIRRAWEIISAESKGSAEALLQMAVKAVNDTAGPDGLVPTLLVFGAYPRINNDSPPTTGTLQKARILAKATDAVRKLADKRKVTDALAARNGPNVERLLPSMLPLGSEVRVWRERKGWQGPYKVLATNGIDVTVDDNGPRTFRATAVRPYNRFDDPQAPEHATDVAANAPFEYPAPPVKRGRGRPRKNAVAPVTPQAHVQAFVIEVVREKTFLVEVYLSSKEVNDRDLSLRLRKEGVIVTPGRPFEASQLKELEGLFQQGVLRPCHESEAQGSRVFKARFVDEIKGKMDPVPYEKSRLVVAGHSDAGKKEILTQSPTIQRVSQRLVLALAPTLRHKGYLLWLRDITQAYVQSKSQLQRRIFVRLPPEIKENFPEGTILEVVKPLYGIAEAGLHWYATYHTHHLVKLHMEESSFDPCLLVTLPEVDFGITALQTDDTLNLSSQEFMDNEEIELQKAGFKAKPRTILADGMTGDFNGCRVRVEKATIEVIPKGQGEKLELVDPKAANRGQQYVEQRARGAYLATICQPEAMFGYSVAAQAQPEPTDDDVDKLNKWLAWSKANMERGLHYVAVDLPTARLMMFADGSFANNNDLSSQIGFVICLVNEEPVTDDSFRIAGNVLHYQSVKCKRVTRSSLASEVYGLTQGFDLAYVLGATLDKITARLGIPPLPLIVCTDSRSLYDCIVKLGTTSEKRLMIDILALRQSYEHREISEIRWIKGDDNPADAMTKAVPNKALESLVSRNELTVRVDGSVVRNKAGDKELEGKSAEE